MTVLSVNKSFAEKVKEKSGQPIDLCYQCQKCNAGCSMARTTDQPPSQVLRLIQFGQKEKVLAGSMIWICSGCEICGARCPNGIKMSEVMDALKEMAIREKNISKKRIWLFHKVFLDTVRSRGRIHEALMMAWFKIRTLDLFSDIDLGLKMFVKGKLPITGKKIKQTGKFRAIFDKSGGTA